MSDAFKTFLFRYVSAQIVLAVVAIVGAFTYGFATAALHFTDAETRGRQIAAAYPVMLGLVTTYSVALAVVLARRGQLGFWRGVTGCVLGNLIAVTTCWPLSYFVGHALELTDTLAGGLVLGAGVTAAYGILASYCIYREWQRARLQQEFAPLA
jgi:hypothetical protein